MDQAVLMYPDIHKRAEVDHVAHRSCKLHPGLQVLHIQHIGPQDGLGQFIARIPSRFFQFLQHVLQGRQAHADLPGQLFLPVALRPGHDIRNSAVFDGLDVIIQNFQQLLCRVVAFRMDARRVQRVFAVSHPQEARALLEGPGPELRNFLQRLPRRDSVLLPVGNNVLCQGGADACHMAQQLRRGRGDLHADLVHALLHHAVQRVGQFILLQVVLILSHTDRLRIDLHQFCQRILHPPCNGDRAALGHVKVREFRCSQLARGINRGPRLRDDHISHTRHFRQQRRNELLAFPAGRAVADCDSCYAVLLHKSPDQPCRGCLTVLVARQGKEADTCIQHLAVLVDHSQLAACTETRVHAEGYLALHRRLHQQLMEILAEYADSLHVRPVRQFIADFPLQRGENQPFPCVLACQRHLFRRRAGSPDVFSFQR